MIRLHMLNDQIIRLPCAEGFCHVVKPFVGEFPVDGIHHGGLLIENYVGIVGHSVRDDVLPLKEIDLMIVDADVADVVCNLH